MTPCNRCNRCNRGNLLALTRVRVGGYTGNIGYIGYIGYKVAYETVWSARVMTDAELRRNKDGPVMAKAKNPGTTRLIARYRARCAASVRIGRIQNGTSRSAVRSPRDCPRWPHGWSGCDHEHARVFRTMGVWSGRCREVGAA